MPGLNFSPNWSLLIKNHKCLLEIWYNSADGWRERSSQEEGLFFTHFLSWEDVAPRPPHCLWDWKRKIPCTERLHADMSKVD